MKDFILIAPLSIASNKKVFEGIKNNELRFPPSFNRSPRTGKELEVGNGWLWFNVKNDYYNEIKDKKHPVGLYSDGNSNKCAILAKWLTNVESDIPYYKIDCNKQYTPEQYPKLDNYDAISVKRWPNIPKDYDGVMAVPITYLLVHNPNDFEIIELLRDAMLNGKKLFYRILIRRKK